ncbi:MAG: thioredoxin [Methyloligella sp.]|nr:MAG: thioredoxin [Methyloligella sp.]
MFHPRRRFLKTSVFFSAYMAGQLSQLSLAKAKGDDDLFKSGNGLYSQPWFEDGFLDLAEEIQLAAQDGKQLVIIYEQEGCPYCKELHQVNLKNPAIKKFMQENYRVIQLDIRGSREVTDFEGKTFSEKEFSRKWQVNFTPTLSFFPADPALVLNKKGKEAEAFRLTGFWKVFHFETVLRFVKSGAYKKDTLQDYLNERIKGLKETGKSVKIWD